MNVDSLMEGMAKLNISGLRRVNKNNTIKKNGSTVLLAEFWGIEAAMQNKKEMSIKMIMDPLFNGRRQINFYIPRLGVIASDENISMSDIYIRANAHTCYGAFRCNAQAQVYYSYLLPLPFDDETFPDGDVLQDIVQQIYKATLYSECEVLSKMVLETQDATDEDKDFRINRIKEVYYELIGPVNNVFPLV